MLPCCGMILKQSLQMFHLWICFLLFSESAFVILPVVVSHTDDLLEISIESVRNALNAAPLIFRLHCSDHITSALTNLKQLNVTEWWCIAFAALAYKLLGCDTRQYLPCQLFTSVTDLVNQQRPAVTTDFYIRLFKQNIGSCESAMADAPQETINLRIVPFLQLFPKM